ncbi:MAG: DUF481 domain-containing protein [Thermoanaerobaculia bacterium]
MNCGGDERRIEMLRSPSLLIALVLALVTYPAHLVSAAEEAEEDEARRWSDQAELTYLATSGNVNAETLGFRNTLIRHWSRGRATLEAGAVRAEDTRKSRTAVLLPSGRIQIDEATSTELTAESYFLRGRYDREFSERLFWFLGTGWEQNDFAGIDRRVSSVGGVGIKWYEKGDEFFNTDVGITLTDERDVSGSSRTFAGARFSWSFAARWTATTLFESQLKLNQNLEDFSDSRADLINSVAVAMTSRLAVKLSLHLLFDTQPAFETLEVVNEMGQATGEVIALELEQLDSIVNASLAVSF